MTTPDTDMIRLALRGFQEARARVAAAPATTADHMYVPLTEATWWAICVDKALEETPGYKSRRNTSPEGRTVAGLNYARSALGHHWTFIAQPTGGLTIPFTVPFTITVVPRWVPVEDLPTFEKQGNLRRDYVERVAGRKVLETLDDAGAWFSGVLA